MDALEFAKWQADYRIEPFGDDWMQASVIASEMRNAGQIIQAAQIASAGGRSEPDIVPLDYFVPSSKKRKQRRRRMTAQESEAAAAARYG